MILDAAARFHGLIGEGIDRLIVVPDLEMEMRELGVAGETDLAQPGAGHHLLARLHGDAAVLHMTVLRDPAVTMIDQDAIAGFMILDRRCADLPDTDILHAVTGPEHGAGSGCDYIDAS